MKTTLAMLVAILCGCASIPTESKISATWTGQHTPDGVWEFGVLGDGTVVARTNRTAPPAWQQNLAD